MESSGAAFALGGGYGLGLIVDISGGVAEDTLAVEIGDAEGCGRGGERRGG